MLDLSWLILGEVHVQHMSEILISRFVMWRCTEMKFLAQMKKNFLFSDTCLVRKVTSHIGDLQLYTKYLCHTLIFAKQGEFIYEV